MFVVKLNFAHYLHIVHHYIDCRVVTLCSDSITISQLMLKLFNFVGGLPEEAPKRLVTWLLTFTNNETNDEGLYLVRLGSIRQNN